MHPSCRRDDGATRASFAHSINEQRLRRERATQIAATIGKVCAFLLGGLGLWAGNLLLMLVAVVVYSGAQGELVQERLQALAKQGTPSSSAISLAA